MFSLTYRYDADGYITEVTDQQGFKTTYTYDTKDNLTSIVDRNGFGATNSDAAYFRALRADLGFVDAGGNGKLVADLSAAEKTAILAKFTTSFTYDANGNLISRTDNAGNLTTYTYTAFNKLASETAAMGNALASSDDAIYQQKRTELGFPASVASLTQAQKDALKALYTTTYTYDAKQNLIERKDPGGDLTRFEYDAFGNLTRKIVFLDPSDLVTPAKQQVTQFFYDAFGNNVETVDGEGAHTFRTFDHFGNVLTSIDGRGGVTTNTYDADNRLLTTTDPEGHTTVNAFDAVGNRISITDANGHTITQVFDRNNLLIATIDPSATAALTRTTTFKYDILGNRTEVTDAEGRKTTYTFDARRQLVDVATPQVLNGSEQLVTYHTTYAYDGEGNIDHAHRQQRQRHAVARTPPHGLLKRADRRDRQRHRVPVRRQPAAGAGHHRRAARAGAAPRAQVRLRRGESTHRRDRRAGQHHPLCLRRAGQRESRHRRERPHHRLRVRPQQPPVEGDPAGGHRSDSPGSRPATRCCTSTTPTATRSRPPTRTATSPRFTFDKDNRQVMVTDAQRHQDRLQLRLARQRHAGSPSAAELDAQRQRDPRRGAGDELRVRRVQSTRRQDRWRGQRAGRLRRALYQQMRVERGLPALKARLTAATKADILNPFTERSEYDRVGNLIKRTDHLGRVTLEYDALDRLQSRPKRSACPRRAPPSFATTATANVIKSTDALGRVTRFQYDAANRLTDATEPSASSRIPNTTTSAT